MIQGLGQARAAAARRGCFNVIVFMRLRSPSNCEDADYKDSRLWNVHCRGAFDIFDRISQQSLGPCAIPS
jgi:hypothetical protein